MKLLLQPFGDPDSLLLPYSAIKYLGDAIVHLPMFGAYLAATLVTYAELRFREVSTTTTCTLAREVPP
jgi:hypothetical protein